MNSIAAHAAYLPRYVLTRKEAAAAWPRLPMPVASRSVPSLDEDPVTMAAEVALLALERAGVSGADLSGVFFASCSGPYVVKSAAAVIADYVGAPGSACVIDAGSGSHAGLLTLVNALRDRELAARGPILVVGADAIFGEPNDAADLAFGAGAVAFVVATEGFATLETFATRYSSYSNIWQTPGDTSVHRYDDDRFERYAGYPEQMTAGLEAFLGSLDAKPEWYALQLHGTDGDKLAGAAGLGREQVAGRDLVQRAGDTGCANALLNLTLALEQAAPGESILAQAYGAGTVTALLRVEKEERPAGGAADVLPDGRIELTYVQYAKHRGLIPMQQAPSLGSPFVAGPAWERSKHYTVALRGLRCDACGSLNFPRRSYCLDCRGQVFTEVDLPRRATVVTYNLQYIVAIGPEEAPLAICTAVLEGEQPGRYGGKVAALITDADPDAIQVGTVVELVPRRGDVEEGLVKYGWKFRPVKEVAPVKDVA